MKISNIVIAKGLRPERSDEHWCCDVTVEPIRKTVTTVGVEPHNVTRVINTTYQRDCKFGETPTSADGWLCEDVVSHVMTTTEMVEVNKTMVVEYPGRCPAHHLSCCEGYEKVGNQCIVFFSPFISIRSNKHNTENNKQRKEANTKSRENGKIPEILCPEGEIPLAVHYQMLDLDSMGDEISGSNLVKSDEEYIAALLNWTQANKNSSCIRESSLLQFWSPGKRVGDLWILYGSQEGELSHNRHDPPAYSGIQAVIFDLLQTFHPRPFLQTRFEPRGGYAVLRAYNGDIVDIFIRLSFKNVNYFAGSGRTLREGPLASPPVMKFLQKNFISSWSLVARLKKLSHSKDSFVAKAAADTLEAYSYTYVQNFELIITHDF
uniref:Selenoprotein N n=1 Tax=Magallana gigas TaxID=29159 RepID=K1QGY7_MAGGI